MTFSDLSFYYPAHPGIYYPAVTLEFITLLSFLSQPLPTPKVVFTTCSIWGYIINAYFWHLLSILTRCWSTVPTKFSFSSSVKATLKGSFLVGMVNYSVLHLLLLLKSFFCSFLCELVGQSIKTSSCCISSSFLLRRPSSLNLCATSMAI